MATSASNRAAMLGTHVDALVALLATTEGRDQLDMQAKVLAAKALGRVETVTIHRQSTAERLGAQVVIPGLPDAGLRPEHRQCTAFVLLEEVDEASPLLRSQAPNRTQPVLDAGDAVVSVNGSSFQSLGDFAALLQQDAAVRLDVIRDFGSFPADALGRERVRQSLLAAAEASDAADQADHASESASFGPDDTQLRPNYSLTQLRETYSQRLSALRQEQENIARLEHRREASLGSVGTRAHVKTVLDQGNEDGSIDFDVSEGDFDDECTDVEPDDNGSRTKPSSASPHASSSEEDSTRFDDENEDVDDGEGRRAQNRDPNGNQKAGATKQHGVTFGFSARDIDVYGDGHVVRPSQAANIIQRAVRLRRRRQFGFRTRTMLAQAQRTVRAMSSEPCSDLCLDVKSGQLVGYVRDHSTAEKLATEFEDCYRAALFHWRKVYRASFGLNSKANGLAGPNVIALMQAVQSQVRVVQGRARKSAVDISRAAQHRREHAFQAFTESAQQALASAARCRSCVYEGLAETLQDTVLRLEAVRFNSSPRQAAESSTKRRFNRSSTQLASRLEGVDSTLSTITSRVPGIDHVHHRGLGMRAEAAGAIGAYPYADFRHDCLSVITAATEALAFAAKMGLDIRLDSPARPEPENEVARRLPKNTLQTKDRARQVRAERRKRRTAAAHSSEVLAARPTWRPASSPSPITKRDRGPPGQASKAADRLLPELDRKVSTRHSSSRSRTNPNLETARLVQPGRHTKSGMHLHHESSHRSRIANSVGRPEHSEAWSVVTNPAALAASWHDVPPLERYKNDRKPRYTDGRVSFSALHGNRARGVSDARQLASFVRHELSKSQDEREKRTNSKFIVDHLRSSPVSPTTNRVTAILCGESREPSSSRTRQVDHRNKKSNKSAKQKRKKRHTKVKKNVFHERPTILAFTPGVGVTVSESKASSILDEVKRRLRRERSRQSTAAARIQAWMRGHVVRRDYLELRASATTIQRYLRPIIQACIAEQKRQTPPAILIQTWFRMCTQRNRFLRLRASIRLAQSAVRGIVLTVLRAHQMQFVHATVKLQCLRRQLAAHRRVARLRWKRDFQAALCIQGGVRGFFARRRVRKLRAARRNAAAMCIQCAWRQSTARDFLKMLRIELLRQQAAITLQCAVRSWQSRRSVMAKRARRSLEHDSATVIQCTWRSREARADVKKRRYIRDLPALRARCASRIQAASRRFLCRRNYLRQIQSVEAIQRVIRGHCQRERTRRIRHRHASAAKIQNARRIVLANRRVSHLRGTVRHLQQNAIRIQVVARGWLARKRLQELKEAREKKRNQCAVAIQCAMRSFVARRRLHRLQKAWLAAQNAAAQLIQRHVRGLLARRRFKRELLIAQSRHMSATKIQASVKGFFQRRQFQSLRSATAVAQRCWRGSVARYRHGKVKTKWIQLVAPARNAAAASVVQRLSLCIFAAEHLNELRQAEIAAAAAIAVQTYWRMHRLRHLYHEQRSAAILVQSFWRAVMARQAVRSKRKCDFPQIALGASCGDINSADCARRCCAPARPRVPAAATSCSSAESCHCHAIGVAGSQSASGRGSVPGGAFGSHSRSKCFPRILCTPASRPPTTIRKITASRCDAYPGRFPRITGPLAVFEFTSAYISCRRHSARGPWIFGAQTCNCTSAAAKR
eukprot:INCI5104.5.p1 GENE.INCI5104.5~~INCI5104.5.p1  ORF type:complete len:1661 (+),score=235.32 INCI5104.5:251-5233(+)